MGRTLIYRVSFTVGDDSTRHQANVQVIEGYSTFGDIPKIVAITRGVDASEVTVQGVCLTAVRSEPQ